MTAAPAISADDVWAVLGDEELVDALIEHTIEWFCADKLNHRKDSLGHRAKADAIKVELLRRLALGRLIADSGEERK